MATSEVKVGAFALSGAAILAGIISFMGAFSWGRGGYELAVSYPEVSGLMQGQEVRYAGVKVGTVKSIDVAPDKVNVIVKIDDNIKIPKGADFTIGADGILGAKFVSILPPVKVGQEFIPEGANVKGVSGGGMEELMNGSGDVMKRFDNIARGMENIMGDKETQEAMKGTIKNMNQMTAHMSEFTKIMADVMKSNQQDFANIARQMAITSQTMAQSAAHIQSMAANADNNGATGRNVAIMAQNMANTTAKMEKIVDGLQKFVDDPETKKDLQATLKNVKETSEKANKMLGTFSNAEFKMDAGSSLSDQHWRGNFGVNLRPSDKSSAYIGFYDIGKENKFDFIVDRKFGPAALSVGSMQGEFGVGLGYDFGKTFRLYSQVYDFDNAKVRLGGEVKLNDSFSLYGESMDLKGSKKDTYVGVRGYF
mgnify:CR=1 FL=1